MKNTLGDLNNHLFAQLERLGDESLKGDALLEEIGRAKSITNVAQQIVNNGNLTLNAIKVKEEFFPESKTLPEFFPDASPVSHQVNAKKIPDKIRIGYKP